VLGLQNMLMQIYGSLQLFRITGSGCVPMEIVLDQCHALLATGGTSSLACLASHIERATTSRPTRKIRSNRTPAQKVAAPVLLPLQPRTEASLLRNRASSGGCGATRSMSTLQRQRVQRNRSIWRKQSGLIWIIPLMCPSLFRSLRTLGAADTPFA